MVSRPHGGRLVNRVAKGRRREALLAEARELPRLDISKLRAIDILDIAYGAFSPLEGFLVQDDYLNVLDNMRLSNDLPWTLPIVLDADPVELTGVKEGDDIALYYNNKPFAIMRIEEIYGWDKKEYARKVYKTTDTAHPGVKRIMNMKELLLGGPIDLIGEYSDSLDPHILWPAETRILFRAKGWKRIVAFQTRNVPHRGHEFVQKAALTFVDGLLVHPLIGWKKPGDYRDEVIIAAYKALIQHYFPKDVVVLAGLRMNMNYAGPREAVHHLPPTGACCGAGAMI
jgi:sulfate adenylyltransferase